MQSAGPLRSWIWEPVTVITGRKVAFHQFDESEIDTFAQEGTQRQLSRCQEEHSITSQSPFFQHYSTGARYFKSNSEFLFSRHMLPCMHSLSRVIFHKIVKIRQCKIPNKPCLAPATARKRERALACRNLGQRLCSRSIAAVHLHPAFLLPILDSCSVLTVIFFGESPLLSNRMR